MRAVKTAATAATLTALVVGVGGAAFLLTNEDSSSPPTPTTTSTTQGPPTDAELAAAIANGLADGLEVPLTAAQAGCIADAFLTVIGGDVASDLVDEPTPLGAVSVAQREEIVRGIVECVPPDVAGALLGTPTTVSTLTPVLPDEGT